MKPKFNTARFRNRTLGASLVTVLFVSFSNPAGATLWVGDTSNDWNDNLNWAGDAGTVGTNAIINTTTPNIATVTANIPANPVDIMVGDGGGTSGRLDHTSGTVSTGGGNWMYIGRGGGTGVYNLANVSGSGGTLTGFAQGTGSLTTNGGRLYVGGFNGGGGIGTANVNTSGPVTIGNDLAVGSGGGTGVMNVDSGAITTGGWNFIGKNEGGGGANGTLNMSGGSITNTGRTWVGQDNCTGVIHLSGGAYKHTNNELLSVGDGTGGNGTIILDNAASLLQANGELWFGQNNGTGLLTFSAGTITSGNWVAIGRDGGNGTVNMSGGTWNKVNGGSSFIVGASGPGTMNQTGGLVDVQGGDTWMGENNTANYTLSSTGEFRATYFQVARNSGSTGNVNLNGGTLRANQIVGGGGTENVSFNGTQIIARVDQANFIGGMDAGGATIDAGGLLVDSNGFTLTAPQAFDGAGDVVKSGAGKLTLSGLNSYTGNNIVNDGELVLSSSGTGTGNISVADGKALGVSATVFVGDQLPATDVTFGTTAAGTTFNATIGNAAGANPTDSILDVTGNLTLNGDVTVNVTGSQFEADIMPLISYVPGSRSGSGNFVLGTLPNGVVATLVDDPDYLGSGDGLVYLDITSVALPEWDGTNEVLVSTTCDTTDTLFDITVADATGIVIGQEVRGEGITVGTTVSGISGTTITLDTAATATAAGIDVDFVATPGTDEGVWDIATTANWVDQVSTLESTYLDPNPVLFSDTATGPTAVTLDVQVKPSDVQFNNDVKNYSLSGSGKISDRDSGVTGLTKSGAADLDISITDNDYTGVTNIAGGITTIPELTNAGVASAIGAASDAPGNLVFGGGTLNVTGPSAGNTIDRGFTIAGAGGGLNIADDLTVSGQVLSTGGNFRKQGAGDLTLTFDGANTLGNGGQAVYIDQATLIFDGTSSPSQVNTVNNEMWIGTVENVSANLTVLNTTLNMTSWLAIARGIGTGTCDMTVTNSTVTTGNFSFGYNNGLLNNSSVTTVAVTDSSWTNAGTLHIAESADSSGSVTLTNSDWKTDTGNADMSAGTNTSSTLTIDADSEMKVNQFLLAKGTGSVATVIVDGGSLNKTGGSWMSIGNSNNGMATVTIKNGGSLTSAGGDLNIGDVDTANGTLNLEGASTASSGGNVFIGKNGTTGVLNMSGSSTMTGAELNVAGNAGSSGNLNISGTAAYTANGRLQVGPGGGSTGAVLIEGFGGMTVNSYVSVGYNGGGTMTVKDNATFSNTDDFSVNESGDVPATVTFQDSANVSVARTVFVGRNTGRVGTLNVSGAAILNQVGATYSFVVGGSGTGTMNISGTSAVNSAATGGMVLTNNATGTATVNLNGGTLTVNRLTDAGGSSTFNFNGGVLKAGSAANLDFMSGLDAANLQAGGAFIDTNGQTIAISQVLGDLGGNVTKQGTGTLLINSFNAYVGMTTVSAGTLGGTGSVGGALTVSPGAVIAPGASAGTFTVDDTFGDGSVVQGTYVCEIDGATSDKLAVGGSLNITGATLDFNVLSAPAASVFVIASYGALTGTFTEVDVPAGFSVDYNYMGLNQIALVADPTPYGTWAMGFGLDPLGDGAPGQDADDDGQSNGIEFALGGDPTSGSDNAKIYNLVADSDADGNSTEELLLTIAVRTGTPAFTGTPSPTATHEDFTYTVQGSEDLSTFTTGVTPVSPVTTGLPTAPAGYEYRTFSLDGSDGMPSKGFLRVEITN